jgi:hypothetical protein
MKDQAAADKAADDLIYARSTAGIVDDETRDKILALGGDATRASPAVEQPLADAEPGLTTTSGVHRTPLDPTTAAVPMDPTDPKLNTMAKGFPSVGSDRKSGTPEKRYHKGPNSPQTAEAVAPAAAPSGSPPASSSGT